MFYSQTLTRNIEELNLKPEITHSGSYSLENGENYFIKFACNPLATFCYSPISLCQGGPCPPVSKLHAFFSSQGSFPVSFPGPLQHKSTPHFNACYPYLCAVCVFGRKSPFVSWLFKLMHVTDNVLTLLKIQKLQKSSAWKVCFTHLFLKYLVAFPAGNEFHQGCVCMCMCACMCVCVSLSRNFPEKSKLNEWLSNHALVAKVTIEVTKRI